MTWFKWWWQMIWFKGMKAVIVGYLSVPKGHYLGSIIQLTYPFCKKCRVVHFYPNSSTDNDDLENFRLPTRINDRVNIAFHEICNLVWGYERFPTQLNINRITKILEPLRVEDFPLLYAELTYSDSGEAWCEEEKRVTEKKARDIITELIKIVEKRKSS